MNPVHRWHYVVLGVLVAAATASPHGALQPQPQTTPSPQTTTAPPGNMWSHGTTLNVFGGGAATSGDRAAVGGGAFGWEIKPWLAIEGSGMWLDWGQGAHAFAPSLIAQVGINTPRPFVPFLAGGVGLYHASFNRLDSGMPGFYQRRMMGMSSLGRTITFTDPSLVGGGGVNVFLSRHWTLRPEVVATIVLRDSRSVVVTTGVVRVGYHFEEHPVEPNVRAVPVGN